MRECLERVALRLRSRVPVRAGSHRRQRGSQSLEWVGLGAVVFAIMGAAYTVAQQHGGVVGQTLVDNLSRSLQPGR